MENPSLLYPKIKRKGLKIVILIQSLTFYGHKKKIGSIDMPGIRSTLA